MEMIDVAEAKSRFSELISRAAAGERFIIQRRERSMAALIGTADLERLERSSLTARRVALALGQSEAILEKVEHHELHPPWQRLACGGRKPTWQPRPYCLTMNGPPGISANSRRNSRGLVR